MGKEFISGHTVSGRAKTNLALPPRFRLFFFLDGGGGGVVLCGRWKLSSPIETEPVSSTLAEQGLNHWTARKFLRLFYCTEYIYLRPNVHGHLEWQQGLPSNITLIGDWWCWERLKGKGEGGDIGWDGWMASLTQWTWVWANSRRWWRTGKPDVLHSMGSQRVRCDLATEQQ